MSRKLAILLILLLMGPALGQTVLTESTFSYQVRQGWTVRPYGGMKYKLAFGPVSKKFAPNMNVMAEETALSIDKYCQANEATLKKAIPGIKFKGKTYFTTAKGLKGVKLSTTASQQGKQLAQVFYMFPGRGNTRFVVTCTTLIEQAAKYAPAFDKSMKTFVVK